RGARVHIDSSVPSSTPSQTSPPGAGSLLESPLELESPGAGVELSLLQATSPAESRPTDAIAASSRAVPALGREVLTGRLLTCLVFEHLTRAGQGGAVQHRGARRTRRPPRPLRGARPLRKSQPRGAPHPKFSERVF